MSDMYKWLQSNFFPTPKNYINPAFVAGGAKVHHWLHCYYTNKSLPELSLSELEAATTILQAVESLHLDSIVSEYRTPDKRKIDLLGCKDGRYYIIDFKCSAMVAPAAYNAQLLLYGRFFDNPVQVIIRSDGSIDAYSYSATEWNNICHLLDYALDAAPEEVKHFRTLRYQKHSEQRKQYYQEHKEHLLAISHQWRQDHLEYARQYSREYDRTHKEARTARRHRINEYLRARRRGK